MSRVKHKLKKLCKTSQCHYSSIPNECEFLKPVSENIFTKTVTHLFSYYGLRNVFDASRSAITQNGRGLQPDQTTCNNSKTIYVTTRER